MRGRVKTVNEEREFGFIIGEDGNEYFFHFSNVISVDFPTKNSIVEFNGFETDKGHSAKDIKVKEIAVKRPEMIIIGSERIRLNSIKEYGVFSGYWRLGARGYEDIERLHLHVETFQKDIYRFFQDEENFDIYEKRNELDKYFT